MQGWLVVLTLLLRALESYASDKAEKPSAWYSFRGIKSISSSIFAGRFTAINPMAYKNSKEGAIISKRDGKWNLEDVHGNKYISEEERLIGTQNWIPMNDTLQTLKLNFNNCSNKEFACHDGTCLPYESRCNSVGECPDLTDEKNCVKIIVDETYDKNVPAYDPTSQTQLLLKFSLHRILSIDMNKQEMSLIIITILKWEDFRFKQANLQSNIELNTVFYDEWNKIWIPSLLFLNTRNKFQSKNGPDEKDSLVLLGRNFKRRLEDNKEDLIQNYLTENSTIVKKNLYSLTFLCSFDFAKYPFGKQTCPIDIHFKVPDQFHLQLIPDGIELEEKAIGMFHITNVTFEVVRKMSVGQLGENFRIELEFECNPYGMLLTVYIPIIVLNIINQYTNYLAGPGMLEVVLTINATILMTLTSLFISTSNSLPQTDYIKDIDFWLFGNFIYPFIIITIHMLLYMMERIGFKHKFILNGLKCFMQCLLPLMYIMTNVVYFMH